LNLNRCKNTIIYELMKRSF